MENGVHKDVNNYGLDLYHEDEDFFDDDEVRLDDLSDDSDDPEQNGIPADKTRVSIRRQIERRRELQALYSELDDWGQMEDLEDF